MFDPLKGISLKGIKGYDRLGIVIPDLVQIAKFAPDRFFFCQPERNLVVAGFTGFFGYKIDLFTVLFPCFDFIAAIFQVMIDRIFHDFIQILRPVACNRIANAHVFEIELFSKLKNTLSLYVISGNLKHQKVGSQMPDIVLNLRRFIL